jgi:hypothetical protein
MMMVRLIELRSEKRAVRLLRPGRCRQEALRIEVLVRTDKERTEPADGLKVRHHCWTDVEGRIHRHMSAGKLLT